MRGASRCAGAGAGASAVLVLTLATLTASSAPVEAQDEVLGVDMNYLEPYEFCAHEGNACSCNGVARWGYVGGDAPNVTQWVRGFFTALGDLAPHTKRGVLCPPAALFDCIPIFPRHKSCRIPQKLSIVFFAACTAGRERRGGGKDGA